MTFPYVAAFLVLLLAYMVYSQWARLDSRYPIAAALLLLVILLTRSVDEGDRLLLGAIEGLLGRPLPLLRRIGRLGVPRDRR